MINVILAIDSKNGLGINGKLPWNLIRELNIFKRKTLNSVVICGRKTAETLPLLTERKIFCISRKYQTLKSDKNIVIMFKSVEEAYEEAKLLNKNIFIIGGKQLYEYVFKNFDNSKLKVHISFVDWHFTCDTFFDINNLKNFYITNEKYHDDFKHCEMEYVKYGENQYLDLVKDILQNGERRMTRNSETISDFYKHLKFDLREGFPLLTTKKMFIKGIIEELLFFIRGDTNSKILEEKGINIWKSNTNREFLDANGFEYREEGELGPLYGHQWRHFNGFFVEGIDNVPINLLYGIDQLKNIINEIKTNPNSRRILLTTYNPSQVNQGVLWPCHSITIQFYVRDGYLDMFCYNRSSDIILGCPFNIASSSLLLMIIAKLTNLSPRYFNLTLGDVHIYSNHEKLMKPQLEKIPYIFPTIELPEFTTLEEVENLSYENFKIINYKSYPNIKMEMIA